MTSLTTCLVFAVITLGLAALLIKGEDRQWVTLVMLIAWLSLFPLLALMNLWFPFAGGGDDEDYFSLATTDFSSWAEVLDPTQFAGVMAQPGYPWLLSILNQFTGEGLLAFKLLNLAVFVLLIPVWHRIGVELDSRQFGRAMALAILLLTPLWWYWMFLLKDLLITLLQSIFLLGAVQVSGRHSKGGWLLVFGATLALIPFRVPLVLLNVAVLAGTATLMLARRGERVRSFATAIMSAIVIAGIITITSDPEWMAAMGIYSEDRVIGSEETEVTVSQVGEASLLDRGLFPLLYLFSETSGLNLKTWFDFDAISLRGALAIPWIVVVVPFFVLGLLWLMRRDPQTIQRGGIMACVRSTRLVATPWGAVLMFILVYLALSWTVGDTTRWRIPDMPAMAAVAMAGWFSMAERSRRWVLMVWIGFVGGSVALFNLVRGL
jgi:hypothetical protein